MLMEEALGLFLLTRQRGVYGARHENRPRSIENYKQDLRVFVDFLSEKGVVQYEDIRRMHILQYNDHVRGLDLSEASKLKLFRALKAFLRWATLDPTAIEEGLKNWTACVPTIKATPRKMYVPSKEDINRLLSSINTRTRYGHRDFVVMSLLLDTGMRIGEVCLLQTDHIKLDNKCIIVPEGGKSGTRLVPLSEQMVRTLKVWMKRREKWAKCDYVFINRTGIRTRPTTYDQSFRRYGERVGLKGITPHTFRHYFCTRYLEEGGNIEHLKAITGHTSYAVLGGYVKLGMGAIQEAHEKMSPLRKVRMA